MLRTFLHEKAKASQSPDLDPSLSPSVIAFRDDSVYGNGMLKKQPMNLSLLSATHYCMKTMKRLGMYTHILDQRTKATEFTRYNPKLQAVQSSNNEK